MINLNKVEKSTFILLMAAAFFNGFIQGLFYTQDIIVKKALHAPDWQVTLIVMLWPVSNLFSIWWGKLLEHSPRISKYFLLLAFAGRLPLILMLFVGSFFPYLSILVLVFSFNALLSPAQNTIYQANFRAENRGTVFGINASILTLVVLTFSFFSGKLLDINEDWFRYIFMMVGIMGVISSLFLAKIKIRKNSFRTKAFISWKQLISGPIIRTLEVFRINKYFAYFERNFFIYGISYIMLLPAIPKYLVTYLNMDYSQTFLAKGVISQLGILFLAPLAGKIFDRKNPAYFTFFTFGLLSLYPFLLLISSFYLHQDFVNIIVYLAFFIFGIAMSAIFISWNISSIFFAEENDVSMYQSVHVTLTGLRGLIAPALGYAIMKLIGIQAVFLVSATLFLLASTLSYKLYLQMKNEKLILNKREMKYFIYLRKIFPFN